MTITEIKDKIIEHGIEPFPGSINQIEELKSYLNINYLPSVYIDFLQQMGNGTRNGFLQGHSCFFNELPNLKKWAIELLIENNSNLALTSNDFVFWMSQGYMFTFFKIDEGDDPPVYFYTEISNPLNFIKISETLSEFFTRLALNDKELFKI